MFPRTIYKFRSWSNEKHKKVLTDNELYLAPPNSFNDPYDCRITKSYRFLNTPEKVEDYINYLRNKDGEQLRSKGKDVDYIMNSIKNELTTDLVQFQENKDKGYYKFQDRDYGIVSFCINWQSILLWSYYADLHQGYAVGFHEEMLRNSGLFGRGGKVQYRKKLPFIDPKEEDVLKRAFTETHTKSTYWRHEREYRLTKLLFEGEDRRVHFPDNFIKEVIIGSQATNETIDEIKQITTRKLISTYKLKRSKFKFGLIKESI